MLTTIPSWLTIIISIWLWFFYLTTMCMGFSNRYLFYCCSQPSQRGFFCLLSFESRSDCPPPEVLGAVPSGSRVSGALEYVDQECLNLLARQQIRTKQRPFWRVDVTSANVFLYSVHCRTSLRTVSMHRWVINIAKDALPPSTAWLDAMWISSRKRAVFSAILA